MMSELEALGARIASCRGARSQKQLAAETGLDVSTISRIERGVTDPTYGTLGKIRKHLMSLGTRSSSTRAIHKS